MPTLADAAIPTLWLALLPLVSVLIGGALTLLGQWWSLTYQTRRQRQARRADRQETRLLALQDLLGEVDDCVRRAMSHRFKVAEEFEQVTNLSDKELETHLRESLLSESETLRSLTYRLRLLAAGVEHEPLHVAVEAVSRWTLLAPTALSYQDFQDARENLIKAQNEAVDLLGEQLRKLP